MSIRSAVKPFERLAGHPQQYRWPAPLARLLGQVPDDEIARLARVHLRTVLAERRRRGIPPARPRRPDVRWTAAMDALLGTASDRDVAAELALPVHCVHRRRR